MRDGERKIDRRSFVRNAGVAAALGMMPCSAFGGLGYKSPNEKIRIAGVGVGGRGGAVINGVGHESIVALCDVDEKRSAGTARKFPDAKRFKDYRKMLDAVEKEIDAVTVGTPDHSHAVILIDAMKRGKHVYSEKPLAHSVYEIRRIREVAKKYKLITQLGNQGHSSVDTPRCVEMVRDGAVGKVTHVYAGYHGGIPYSLIKDLEKLKEKHEVPAHLDWDLWLGPADRPYHPMYCPFTWRNWLAFGTGAIGDWICHTFDPAFSALQPPPPVSIVAETKGYDLEKHGETYPPGTKIVYEFPEGPHNGAFTFTWSDKGFPTVPPDAKLPQPPEEKKPRFPGIGAAIVGDKGYLMHGSHGASHLRLFPDSRREDYDEPDPTLPRVKDAHHQQDWLDAIRAGRPGGSHFEHGGPMTELALLGLIAIRFPGKKLKWNAEAMKFDNCPEADGLIRPPMRKGWTLDE